MSIYGMFKKAGPNGFGYNTTADEVAGAQDLSGQTWLLTGCNSGLGLETMRVLLVRGARVIAAARTEEKARNAIASIAGAKGEGVPLACELSEPENVRAAVAKVKELGFTLDGVIANAGIMALPKPVRKHGYELQFLTNHIGHFILVTGILEQLSDTGRVVMLSSTAHTRAYPEGIRFDDLDAQKGYSAWGAYGQSKLANLLFAKELANRLPKPGQRAMSVHPGVIATNLGRHMNGAVIALFGAIGPILALKTVPQGASTQIYAALHPAADDHNGLYLKDCNPGTPSRHGQDAALAKKLWEKTEEIVASL